MSSTLSKMIVKISSGNSKRTVDEQVNVGYQFILFVLFICFGASLYLIANAATLIMISSTLYIIEYSEPANANHTCPFGGRGVGTGLSS